MIEITIFAEEYLLEDSYFLKNTSFVFQDNLSKKASLIFIPVIDLSFESSSNYELVKSSVKKAKTECEQQQDVRTKILSFLESAESADKRLIKDMLDQSVFELDKILKQETEKKAREEAEKIAAQKRAELSEEQNKKQAAERANLSHTYAAPQSPQIQSPSTYGDTTVLSNNFGETMVLDSYNSKQTFAVLIKMSTSERIFVTNTEFKIGKEYESVNYCVANNPSVSRIHAIIISRDGEFFLRDNNSTNGSFINEMRIQRGGECKIRENDVIRLSNEVFMFTVF